MLFVVQFIFHYYDGFFTFTKHHASLSLFLVVILKIILNNVWVWAERALVATTDAEGVFSDDSSRVDTFGRLAARLATPVLWPLGKLFSVLKRLGVILMCWRWFRSAGVILGEDAKTAPSAGLRQHAEHSNTPLLSAARRGVHKKSLSTGNVSLSATGSSSHAADMQPLRSKTRRDSPTNLPATYIPAPLPTHSMLKLRTIIFLILLVFGVSILLFFNVLVLNVDRWLNTFCLMVDLVVWFYILGVLLLISDTSNRDMSHLPMHKKSAAQKKARASFLTIFKLFYLRDLFHVVFGFTVINFFGFLFKFRFPIELTSCLWHFIIFLGPIFFCFVLYDFGIVGWQYADYLRVVKRKWFILGGGTLLCVAGIRALTDAVVLRDLSLWNREWTIIAVIPSVGNFLLIHAVQRFGREMMQEEHTKVKAADSQKTK
uniref:Uncharacterized protein n=1 Tax=Percolomonas cosmopolitus TaxID=63605 RepID=A0A7S1PHE4_9EUKA|eukprot:CAMPEP_0117434598 /NCGR_PEP_ID=MMETSP0759-20121206/35_1 /TAXON_ID=63605 /ORGANISM="Percolomonas cosmopolitus, Strain WS" /LENGTH=429 /DNA_ID=CAMNT_0005226093 /DNA_START=67 /DNA_END=1356 /DNA_ORIENTATION=+